MTDRVHSLTVALGTDVREDDVGCLADAIRQFRGVINVEKNISDPDQWVAESRVRDGLRERIWKALEG